MKNVKLLSISLLILGLLIGASPAASAKNFSDVPANHWAIKEIQFLSDLEIINGYENGSFGVASPISRADAAIMIARTLNLNTNERSNLSFEDVPATHYAYDEIAAVVDEGIFQKGELFNPSTPLKRGEMAKIIVEAFNLQAQENVGFKDTTASHWAYPYISTLVANQITTGYTDLTFKPNQNITRTEFSVLIARVKDDSFKPALNIVPQHLTGEIFYPKVFSADSLDTQKINAIFQEHAEIAKNNLNELIEFGKEYNDPLLEYYTVASDYQVKYNDGQTISVLFNDYEYAGGAHGMYYYSAYNYDFNKGKVLQLKDLFKENSNYVSVINAEIKKQINQLKQTDQYYEITPFESIDPDTDQFYITSKGIGIFFSLYEYTAYAYGIPEFIIPYSAFGNMMK